MYSQGNNDHSMYSQSACTAVAHLEPPEKQYEWTTQATDLLARHGEVLDSMLSSWQSFSSQGGDIEYFRTPGSYVSEKSEQHVSRLLSSINTAYATLGQR